MTSRLGVGAVVSGCGELTTPFESQGLPCLREQRGWKVGRESLRRNTKKILRDKRPFGKSTVLTVPISLSLSGSLLFFVSLSLSLTPKSLGKKGQTQEKHGFSLKGEALPGKSQKVSYEFLTLKNKAPRVPESFRPFVLLGYSVAV